MAESSLVKVLAEARRSLEHPANSSLVAKSEAAGYTEARHSEFYRKQLANLKSQVRSLANLVEAVSVGEEEAASLDALVKGIPNLLKDIKRGKKNLRNLWELVDRIQPLNISLKEKHLDQQIESYDSAVNRIIELKSKVEEAYKISEQSLEKTQNAEVKSLQISKDSEELARRLSRIESLVGRRKEGVEQTKKDAEAELGKLRIVETEVETSSRSVKAIQAQLEAFAETTSNHVANMRRVEEEIHAAVGINNKQKEDFLVELEKVRQQADDTLQRSSAGSLYSAYDKRRADLASKVDAGRTSLAIVGTLTVIAAVGIWVASSILKWPITEQYLAKIGILSPFVFLVWFFTVQYNRERLLEEEYASKASMSLSYPAFKEDLINLTRSSDDAVKAQAVTAAIEMSKEIFTDPLRILKGSEDRKKSIPEKAGSPDDVATDVANKVSGLLQATTNLIDKANKLVKPSSD